MAFGLWLGHGPRHGLLQLSAQLPGAVRAAQEPQERAGAAVPYTKKATVCAREGGSPPVPQEPHGTPESPPGYHRACHVGALLH